MQISDNCLKMQNAIICAVHKTDDIEEARRKELQFGCLVLFDGSMRNYTSRSKNYFWLQSLDNSIFSDMLITECTIIWLPPTLDRVLVALWDKYAYFSFYSTIVEVIEYDTNRRQSSWCSISRKLLNEDGTPCNLFDQDQSVQDALHPLLCK